MAGTVELITTSRQSFYDNKPTAFLTQTVAQALTSGTYTPITFGSASEDLWGGWSSGAPTLYTVKVAGLYALGAIVPYAVNTTGTRFIVINYNGTGISGSQNQVIPVGSDFIGVSSPRILKRAVVGDTFSVSGAQNSGGSLSTAISGSLMASFTVEWIRS